MFSLSLRLPPAGPRSVPLLSRFFSLRSVSTVYIDLSFSLSSPVRSRSLPPAANAPPHRSRFNPFPSRSLPSSRLYLCVTSLAFTPPTQRTDDLYQQNNNLISPQLGTIQNRTTKIINKFCAERSCRFQLATLTTPYPPVPAHNGHEVFFMAVFFSLMEMTSNRPGRIRKRNARVRERAV